MEVGDKVKIKSKYDEGCDQYDYVGAFVEDMLIYYGGRVATIEEKWPIRYIIPTKKIKSDGFGYNLNIDNHAWTWSSGMFEEEF